MRHWNEADYVIVNDDVQESLRSLRLILHAERLKRARQEGLDAFVRGLLDV
jgi:guanylate kinase